ncbi:MAG: hypothetical protein ACRDS0_31480 [Pseudonocardiaceae bacterium]
MSAAVPRPVGDRWGDVEGSHISLFSQFEQVEQVGPRGLLPSRLHQQGQVVGRGLDSLYVRFADSQVVSLSPRLLRLLTDVPGDPAHREGP